MSLTVIAKFLSPKMMSNTTNTDTKMYFDEESNKELLLDGGDNEDGGDNVVRVDSNL